MGFLDGDGKAEHGSGDGGLQIAGVWVQVGGVVSHLEGMTQVETTS